MTHDTICEVNFGVSPITMYNIWCLLCHMLHKNCVLTLIWHLCNMWHNLMSNYNFNVIYATINTTHCNRWNHKVWYRLCHEPWAYCARKTTICCSGCQVWNIVSGRSMTAFKIYCHSSHFIFTYFQGSLNEYIYIYISSKVLRVFPHFWTDSNQIRIDRWPDTTMVIEISNLITATNQKRIP